MIEIIALLVLAGLIVVFLLDLGGPTMTKEQIERTYQAEELRRTFNRTK